MLNNKKSLYNSEFEHDSCGIGFVAHLKGKKSHNTIDDALSMLERMEHRGGTGYDEKCGDGAGILLQIPHSFFSTECISRSIKLPESGEYAVAMIFFPENKEKREECKNIISDILEESDMELLGYREVPTNDSIVGVDALKVKPVIEQLFVQKSELITSSEDFERKLYVLRKRIYRAITAPAEKGVEQFSIVSFSSRTIVYKGQLTTQQVRGFYEDLRNPALKTALALIHSRFSTNTFPSWKLAQPFRFLAHNGEINTIKGNINWTKGREQLIEQGIWTQEDINTILPVCQKAESDSANLDRFIEFLYLSGRSLEHVIMMLIPEAWQGDPNFQQVKKAFYEYHACIMEPWDGPASICFTNGIIVGATLDRNGLRPSRYILTKDDRVIMASEAGALKVAPENVVFRKRLQPGKMFIADLEKAEIVSDEKIKQEICSQYPYAEWLKKNKILLHQLPTPQEVINSSPSELELLKKQHAFGITSETLKTVLKPMAIDAKEAIGSMGSDVPVAILSKRAQNLSNYFRQLFAQVTNPPIDPIRERNVMALHTYVGKSFDFLQPSEKHCHKIQLHTPFLTPEDVQKIRYIDNRGFQVKTIDMYFPNDDEKGALEKGLKRICTYAEDAVREKYSVVNLSHRSIDSGHCAIPSLLAVSAVHHFLLRKRLRGKVDIIVEAGDVYETHHFATLLGFGASAISPYVGIESVLDLKRKNILPDTLSDEDIVQNYKTAINNGLLKIISKMGISTIQSFQGAQIFECLGLNSSVVDKYFTGTVSRIEGIDINGIAKEAIAKHRVAFPNTPHFQNVLEEGGVYQWKTNGERHLFNPTTIHLLQQSTKKGDYDIFKQYTKAIDSHQEDVYTLRGILDIDTSKTNKIPLEEVEPLEDIRKRFITGAMSFGSISWEAHTTLAIALNRIGGRSNSGEGGEDEKRYTPLDNGDSMNSATKQVASGRFGVTSHYLSKAQEIQIKMAQGAKPGEGGQLPGFKVDNWIGRVRHSTPGVGLISPPPHHDIYSIEDLAQLIFDLKSANRKAKINVKLVSEAGVGTIAAGVCKAKADTVLISGHDGGTGASPLSSISYAGLPWELGLVETHQTLVKNRLRNRITVQTDGQLRTPRDIFMATLMGAEEWGIATAALVVEGCILMRKCHLNTCPVGIATQNPELRKRFEGNADYLVNFFNFLSKGLREMMAEYGFRTVNEMVGRTDILKEKKYINHWKHKSIDYSAILATEKEGEEETFCTVSQVHNVEKRLDYRVMQELQKAIESGEKVQKEYEIESIDRAFGAIISNEISKKHGSEGLPDNTLHVKLKGSAGQSFGAFSTKGLTLKLEGESNDYFGKGLCGAKLIAFPHKESSYVSEENIIVGNVSFYGATSGEAFIRGEAGERFCVRNSGVHVVVEGVGDHGCEYMTGGKVLILGETGKNFAAGMSGGIAYIYDPKKVFKEKCNMADVAFDTLEKEDTEYILSMAKKHFEHTKSTVAENFIQDFSSEVENIVKVMPNDYKLVLEQQKKEQLETTTA